LNPHQISAVVSINITNLAQGWNMALHKTKETSLTQPVDGVERESNEFDSNASSANTENVEACSEHDKYASIAESAYYKAEARGFAPGYEMQDWLEAETEIDQ